MHIPLIQSITPKLETKAQKALTTWFEERKGWRAFRFVRGSVGVVADLAAGCGTAAVFCCVGLASMLVCNDGA